MSGDCATARISLGVYVLGALGPAERAVTEAHLADCPACRDELVRIAGLPGLLGRLDLAEVTNMMADAAPGVAGTVAAGQPAAGQPAADAVPGPRAGDGVVERALAELSRRRRAIHRRLAVAMAALAVVIASLSVAVTAAVTSSEDVPQGRRLSATSANALVEATIWVAEDPTGTAFTVRLQGIPEGTHCTLVTRDVDGHREIAASWVASYHGTVDVRGASGIALNRLATILVVSDSGEELVSLPARRAGPGVPGPRPRTPGT